MGYELLVVLFLQWHALFSEAASRKHWRYIRVLSRQQWAGCWCLQGTVWHKVHCSLWWLQTSSASQHCWGRPTRTAGQCLFLLHFRLFRSNKSMSYAFSALTLLVGRQEGHPACKKQWWGAGVVIYLERGAELHMAQQMPLPLTVSCFSKIQIVFTFLILAHLGSPGKGPLNGCVCVCKLGPSCV